MPNGLTALLISDVRSISADQIDNDEEKDDDDEWSESRIFEYRDSAIIPRYIDDNTLVIADEEESGSEGSESEEDEDDEAAGDLSDGDVDCPDNKRPRNEEKMVNSNSESSFQHLD